jgi:hypothetical protein
MKKLIVDCLSFTMSKKNYKVHERTKREQRNKRNIDLVFIAFYNDVVFRSEQMQTKIYEVEGTHKNTNEKGTVAKTIRTLRK